MVLTLNFGTKEPKVQITWYEDIMKFHKLIMYKKKKWEWVMYNSISPNEYDITFAEIPTYDPNYHVYMPAFEDLFIVQKQDCECGAKHSRNFQFDHMRFCKKWKPWDKI